MSPTYSEKDDSNLLLSLIDVGGKLFIYIRKIPIDNSTVDPPFVNRSEENDQPDPLRVPELIIVISVLILWCVSIYIFIRHSELLRIRHRDLPYRSSLKSSMTLNHITVINHNNDIVSHSKTSMPSSDILTKRRGTSMLNERKFSTAPNRRRQTRSFDFNESVSLTKPSFDNQRFPCFSSYQTVAILPQSNPKSLEDMKRKSTISLFSTKTWKCYSTNDILRRKCSDGYNLFMNKRHAQESPV